MEGKAIKLLVRLTFKLFVNSIELSLGVWKCVETQKAIQCNVGLNSGH